MGFFPRDSRTSSKQLILMSTRGDSNEYTQYTIFNTKKKITVNSYRIFSKGLKNEFETAVVNEPSVFELLKVHCISLKKIQRLRQNILRLRRLIWVYLISHVLFNATLLPFQCAFFVFSVCLLYLFNVPSSL